MTIFDDIRKDREAGTPGDWRMHYDEDGYTGEIRGTLDSDYDRCIADWVGIYDARRIARVPRLERIALAAEQVVDAVLRSDPWEDIDAALAAFRAACGEGK